MTKKRTPYAELYCQNCQSQHTATNARYRLASFADWLKAEYRITDLEKVKVEHVLAYKGHLAKSGLDPISQARYLETLRSFFRWCCAEGLLSNDPAKGVRSPRGIINRERAYLQTSEMRALFDVIDPKGRHGKRDKAMTWALAMGLRVGEVTTLNVQDVIASRDDKSLPELRIHGKRSYERIIPLPQPAYDALTDYLNTRQAVPQDTPLFVCCYAGESERRLTTRAVQKWFADLARKAGLPKSKWHVHVCRHAFAVRMIYESNMPGSIYTLARMMGHANISVTEKYLHVGPAGRAAMESAVMSDPLAQP